MFGDEQLTVVMEQVVLEKFDGDPEDGKLTERITVVDGKIVSREVFDSAEPQTTESTGA